MRAWVFAVAALACLLPAGALAQPQSMNAVSIQGVLNDTGEDGPHNLVMVCDGPALVYGMNLRIQYNDAGDEYAVLADSVRVGATAVGNDAFVSGVGHTDISMMHGGHTDLPYPLLVPKYSPLTVPIEVRDGEGGDAARAILDVVYAAAPGVECRESELKGPQKIGLLTRLTGATAHINEHVVLAVRLSVQDYNRQLEDAGAAWSLELVEKDNQSSPEVSLERAMELKAEGVTVVVGPSSSSSVAAVREYTAENGMVVASCCSTAPSLAVPDHIFRLVPDDHNQAHTLAKMLDDAGVGVAVTIHRDGPYGVGLNEALGLEMAKRGGSVGAAVPYHAFDPPSQFESIVERLAGEVQGMVDARGAGAVAVVAVSSTEITDIIEQASKYDVLDDVRWYVSEAVVNLAAVTEGETGSFSDRVNLSGCIVAAPSNPLNQDLAKRLRAQLDIGPDEAVRTYAYTAYDAVLVLANAMRATQSAQAADIVEAMPYVSSRTFGAMSQNTLNGNGDLAAADYSIWEVADGTWVRTGTYVESTDSIVPAER